jgi:hypothetical protein
MQKIKSQDYCVVIGGLRSAAEAAIRKQKENMPEAYEKQVSEPQAATANVTYHVNYPALTLGALFLFGFVDFFIYIIAVV